MPPMMPTGRTRRPSKPITADDLLAGGWTAYIHPEGEGYPVPADVRSIIAAARALDPERMDRQRVFRNATAPKVATVAQVERRRRQLRRTVVSVVSWVVIVAVCLLVGWAFADGIGGGR